MYFNRGKPGSHVTTLMFVHWQIGFLTEWQMYAQKIEGDSWLGEKLDIGKIDKMSGMENFEPFGAVY